jgi:hypothetical protein
LEPSLRNPPIRAPSYRAADFGGTGRTAGYKEGMAVAFEEVIQHILLVFLIVFVLNLIPAFAPPTWMVFSYIGFRYPAANVLLFAAVGAIAATLGRLTLARLSMLIIRKRFLGEGSRQNIDVIRERLEKRPKLTFGIFLFYAFTPLPSNYLFIAYGLTAMKLLPIAAPFLLGRTVSYMVWGVSSSVASRWLSIESADVISYMSLYFVATQILLMVLVYVFTKIDWSVLFDERKLRWMHRTVGITKQP